MVLGKKKNGDRVFTLSEEEFNDCINGKSIIHLSGSKEYESSKFELSFKGKKRKARSKKKLKPFLMVKLRTPFEYRNFWATITETDGFNATGIIEKTKKEIEFNADDVKWWVGDIDNDYVSIGEERHKIEIVKEINRVKKLTNS